MRISLNRGEVVSQPQHCLSYQLDDKLQELADGFLQHTARIDRESLIAGIFYAILGMRVGGYRRVEIAPHLAYGEKGIQDVIPPNAKLTVDIRVLKEVEQG
ncbi:MAG: FKBP-type peptidyl-prolyl cis-trans isomerase [gamma proteobacterium symbiont of Bathyaustriella thionipta]|nr:FKBP-type peptidyl-prolyl cis-trans isomerase [gamma proteobacterium symbiont of Bathyaustriella thionipta]